MAAVADISTDAVALSSGVGQNRSSDPTSEFQRDVEKLVDMLSKLNPLAKEFFPSYCPNSSFPYFTSHFNFFTPGKPYAEDGLSINHRRGRNGCIQGRRRLNGRTFRVHQDDSIRRTVYVSDIDNQVTEERLAALFCSCGQVVDCRICGDPNSVLRFAFVEFYDDHGARTALSLSGTVLGCCAIRVLPSKTAILPVNPTFLPRSENEREMCARTVYCTNIDKMVSQTEVKNFFETACGEVSRLRLLGDQIHSTRIAFVEFVLAESAIVALNCSGLILGTQAIRVSPSKTPVRPRAPPPPPPRPQ